MKLTVLQEELAKVLSISTRFVNTRAQLPILNNFLLVTNKTKLQVIATNLEMSILTNIGAKVEEAGSVAIPARNFTDVITNLPKGTVNFDLEKEKLKIKGSGFKGSLSSLPPNDFPSVPQAIDNSTSIKIATSDLNDALSKVLFAVSSDETRPILTGVLFLFEKDSITRVASDGFRLSKKKINLKTNLEGDKCVVPKVALGELVRIASNFDEVVFEIKKKDNQLVAQVGDSYLGSRIIEGEFPNFERIIPQNPGIKVDIDREDLLRSVKLASVFAKEAGSVIKLLVKEASLEVKAESGKVGSETSEIEAKVTGGTLEISFNYKFAEEALSVIDADSVEILLTDPVCPGIFKDPKDKDYLHLIMPVKVQA